MKSHFLIFAVVSCMGIASTGAEPKVERTLSVPRCQAVLDSGKQCPYQAQKGERYCWRHRGAVKVINETMTDAGKGANRAWQSTRTWTTNAFESAKNGASRAVDATEKALEEARVGLNDLLGGKEPKKQVRTAQPKQ